MNRRDLLKTMVTGLGGSQLFPYVESFAQLTFLQPNILYLYCEGGWDTTMVFEDKTTIDTVATQSGCSKATGQGDISYVNHASRPHTQSFFQNFGAKTVIINGIYQETMQHAIGAQNLFTTSGKDLKDRRVNYLDFYTTNLLPVTIPHLKISVPHFNNLYEASSLNITSEQIIEIFNETTTNSLSTAKLALLDGYLAEKFTKELDKYEGDTINYERHINFRNNQVRHNSLSAIIKSNLTGLNTESNDFLRNGKFAINLFKSKVSKCISLRVGGRNAWDTHQDNYAGQSVQFESLFENLALILNYAKAQGVYDNLLVIVASDLGRGPQLNSSSGKGHWPYTSMLLHGPGLNGGSVLGQSGNYLRGLPIDPIFGEVLTEGEPIRIKNIFAALFLKYSIPYTLILPDDIQPFSPLLERV